MKGFAIIGIVLYFAVLTWLEWSSLVSNGVRDLIAYACLVGLGCFLGILLVLFPDLKSPLTWVDKVYKPFSAMLK
ncbi:hypothetical protein BEP19_11425 [Ammoniphilus oxalaticus]|uniref:Uncharacterized protein n=1 Tax=Ammoniphilus oxalaticus TaxID=66863 RepID=A0A419SGH3_9BACL|nr:hypothetical protein [Ammoniphilus oxalaticus]RKD22845.1 hypothetical protein BEP19_11425 [Ammoniphilus oxalaticus]